MEGKHRVFAWLLVQNKLLTADKLLARNWPCNPICPLCDQVEETAAHICLRGLFRCLIPPMSGMKYRRGNLVLLMRTTLYYRLVLRSIKG
jgi:hypothetical protein